MKQAYDDILNERPNELVKAWGGGEVIHKLIHETIGLETRLDIERRTAQK